MKSVLLINITTELEWQLAYLANQHGDPSNKNTLVYATPQGDITLTVETNKRQTVIRRV